MGDNEGRVRFPSLELWATHNQSILADRGRPLTGAELVMAQGIFGQSLNYDVVRISHTIVSSNGRAYTFGNTIRIPTSTNINSSTLVHELTHVWQYQTKGAAYISDSVYHQVTQGAASYDVTIVSGQSFSSYHAEQQAMIVEQYYTNSPVGWRTNPDVVRMIKEVQTARPLSQEQIDRDILGIPQNDPFLDSGPSGSASSSLPSVTPLIRWEF